MKLTPALVHGFLAATSPLSNVYRVPVVVATIYAEGLSLLPSLSDAVGIDKAITRVLSTFLGVGVVSNTRPSLSLSASRVVSGASSPPSAFLAVCGTPT